jgi:hypothetical protein
MKEDIAPRNDKGELHGYCEFYFNNFAYKCFYHNGIRIGYMEYYFYNRNLCGKLFYIN